MFPLEAYGSHKNPGSLPEAGTMLDPGPGLHPCVAGALFQLIPEDTLTWVFLGFSPLRIKDTCSPMSVSFYANMAPGGR